MMTTKNVRSSNKTDVLLNLQDTQYKAKVLEEHSGNLEKMMLTLMKKIRIQQSSDEEEPNE